MTENLNACLVSETFQTQGNNFRQIGSYKYPIQCRYSQRGGSQIEKKMFGGHVIAGTFVSCH